MNADAVSLEPIVDELVRAGPGPWPLALALLPLALGALALALLLLARARHARHARVARPAPTPRARALARLERSAGRIGEIAPRESSNLLCEILREFLAAEHSLPASRRTSQEILAEARDLPSLAPDDRDRLARFLRSADLIRFARAPAGPDDCRRLLAAARDFVKGAQP